MFATDESEVGIVALLGPTNTGKTHRAIERMLEHATGMIGLPLRLLAREVYDRLTARLGERAVALVTGEEKRIPRHPKYWICTVEAMPMDRDVDFLAIDEIQLGAHRERGHVFTDRLLHARGLRETWFLGSETARPLIERLVPTAKLRSHPRLSRLRGTPPVALASLPKRSAVVAFSTQRVYELAERVRNKHSGAAIVLGALSPRTRNAQVALYQSGEVDYMVATDAIGMGLNLDIRHVAFADITKFDGRETRPLELAELAQIAGRAGRYLDDGTFGVLAPHSPLPDPAVRALEHHQFPAETQLFWRNSALDTSSVDALLESLRRSPQRRELRPIDWASDHRALLALRNKPEILRYLTNSEAVSLIWDVCQIPDYPQLLFELHVKLLEQIFLQLVGPHRCLDTDWIDEQLRRIDRIDGDIETLMGRIADIRTWNYVSQQHSWVGAYPDLAERARDIEDRLSDALHDRLVARFVEKRRSFSMPAVGVGARNSSTTKGNPFAQLLSLGPTQATKLDPLVEQARWAERLIEAPHDNLHLDPEGRIHFEDRQVGRLLRGIDLLHPDVQVRLDLDPGRGITSRVQRRLLAFARDVVEQLLAPIRQPIPAELSSAARGLVYQLERGLGTVSRADCCHQLLELCERERQVLASCGLRIGPNYLYYRRLLAPDIVLLRLALAAPHFESQLDGAQRLASDLSLCCSVVLPATLLTAVGAAQAGPLILRVDRYERLVMDLRNCNRSGPFNAPRDLGTRLGCTSTLLAPVLEALGYEQRTAGRWTSREASNVGTGSRSGRPHRTRGRRRNRSHSPTESNSEV